MTLQSDPTRTEVPFGPLVRSSPALHPRPARRRSGRAGGGARAVRGPGRAGPVLGGRARRRGPAGPPAAGSETSPRRTPTGSSSPVTCRSSPGGEAVKNDIHILERMLKVFHAAGLDRRSYVVVIGGGAVLDAVGFAAAIAHRGLRLVRLPTTTLGQADSGVGVKNGVNLFGKKNWLGSFAVPWAVINDTALLATLPDRDFICGFSEAVKVSLLKDPAMFAELCRVGRPDPPARPVGGPADDPGLGRVAPPAHHPRRRPVRVARGPAARLRPLVGPQARSDDRLPAAARRGGGHRRGDRHRLLVAGAWAAPRGRRAGAPLPDRPRLHAGPPGPARHARTCSQGLEEFRQHLGGRLTLTMLRGVGDPIDVHEIDPSQVCAAIERVKALAPPPTSWDLAKSQEMPFAESLHPVLDRR